MNTFETSKLIGSVYKNNKYSTLQDKNKIVVMLSGGVDSTYLLKWLLENTNKKIYVFFHIRNNRDVKILPHINFLVKHFKQYRSFDFDILENSQYLKNSVYTPRNTHMYQSLAPFMWGNGISEYYVGASLCDLESTLNSYPTAKIVEDAIKFWGVTFDRKNHKQLIDSVGGISLVDYRLNFTKEIALTYEKCYNTNWHPIPNITPPQALVTRHEQYQYLFDDKFGIGEKILLYLRINCGHNVQQCKKIEEYCGCHLHYYSLYKLGVI